MGLDNVLKSIKNQTQSEKQTCNNVAKNKQNKRIKICGSKSKQTLTSTAAATKTTTTAKSSASSATATTRTTSSLTSSLTTATIYNNIFNNIMKNIHLHVHQKQSKTIKKSFSSLHWSVLFLFVPFLYNGTTCLLLDKLVLPFAEHQPY